MIVTLEETKLYLRVDADDENELITGFIKMAEDICEGILRYPLSEFVTVPEVVKQAVMYITASMYEKRENVSMKEVIDVAIRLLFSYRKDGF